MEQKRKIEIPGSPESYWLESTPTTEYSALREDISVDVAVIGGGLAGISTAWLLKKEGLRVALLEADRICQGTTAHSTAKITSQHDLIYDHIVTQFSPELARQYAQANENAIKVMADIIKEYNIDCDFQWKPAYVYTQRDEYVDKIQKEVKAALGLGIEADYLEKLELPFDVKAALRFAGQAQFHPRKYVLALAQMIPGNGSEIYENTAVIGLEEGSLNIITTQGGNKVKADKVVIASHFPFHDGLGLYFARMYPDRSYILGVKTPDKLPEGMYVTAEAPGRSLRTQRVGDHEMLLVAGEHHKVAQGKPEAHYENLKKFAMENFDVTEIPYRWSTQDYTTLDKIPFIGNLRSGLDNIYVATGFRKWGISTSTVAAQLIRDLIIWGNSPWQDVYSPQRGIKLNSAGQLVNINFDVAKELVSGKIKSTSSAGIKQREGKIVQMDGRKVGAYQDERGQLHAVDITCTHLGCELEWNGGETTWDCPCHGSRFTYEGDIVEGPALKPLKNLSEGNNDIDPDII